MRRKKIFFFIFILLIFSFFSCSKSEEHNEINLKDHFYWAPCNKNSTVNDAKNLKFKKFSTKGIGNIKKAAGSSSEYVWLMTVFTLPENLRNEPLGLLITYLHFSNEVWVNNNFVGKSGNFPPDEKSTLWDTHFYPIPESLINPSGENIIFIKVYNKGNSGISNTILLGKQSQIQEKASLRKFVQSVIYLVADGGMLFTALLFLIVFLWRKKEKEYLSFSLLCISSMIFVTPFIAPVLPLNYPNKVPFLFFYKATLCEGLYLIVFFLASLIIRFLRKRETKTFFFVRFSILIFCTIFTFSCQSYTSLMQICPLMLALSIFQIFLGFFFILKTKLEESEKKSFFILNLAFIPLIVTITIDIIIKGYLQNVSSPYTSLFGWLITLTNFLVLLSGRYNKAMAQNEYLNIKLRREVLKQTRELHKKNSNLQEQIEHSEADLEMAALVQKTFFPYPPRSLRGWNIAVSYNPLNKVSGDMYDFYEKDDNLYGFSLFDVSGHGIAASLITMLSKNIIFRSFMRNMKNNETVSRTLYEINDEIIAAKGDIQNYLTGIMFRFSAFDEYDDCKVELANAGHPNPIFYNSKTMKCSELECTSEEEHHGAIGLDFITVSFPQINFKMGTDDILVFYTDGLTESRNKKNEMFGKERVKNIIESSFAKDAQSIMEDLIDALTDFTKNAKRDDDITIVVMKRENSANFIEELTEL